MSLSHLRHREGCGRLVWFQWFCSSIFFRSHSSTNPHSHINESESFETPGISSRFRIILPIHTCIRTYKIVCVCVCVHICTHTCIPFYMCDAFICVVWFIHVCDLTPSYARHDSFICVTWLIHMRDMAHSHAWHDSFTCVTWLIHMRDVTHLRAWHDSFTCVTWLIHIRDMTYSHACKTHSHAWHDSFKCVTTHSRTCHDSFTCVTWLIYMRDMTHAHAWHNSWAPASTTIFSLHISRNESLEVSRSLYKSLWISIGLYDSL